MGVRSNVGNITTNAVQIGSVAATTASGLVRGIADASRTLRNKKQQELDASLNPATYAKASNAEEAEAIGKAEFAKRKERALGDIEIDGPEGNYMSVDEIIRSDLSPQSVEISNSVKDNVDWQKNWYADAEKQQELIDKGEI